MRQSDKMPNLRWAEILADALLRAGVRAVAILPDSAVAKVHERLADKTVALRITREEQGIALLAGAYFAGLPGALLMQNTGLGNCINALASFAIPCGVPMLLVVNLRGDVGEFSPAQIPMGLATAPILQALGIPLLTLGTDADVEMQVPGSMKLAIAAKRPVALLLRSTLTGGKAG